MAHPLFHDLVTLIVVVYPIGLVPLFIGVAGQESAPRRKQIALQAVLIAACILLAFIAMGQIMLEALLWTQRSRRSNSFPVRRAASASFVRATGTSRYRLSVGEEGGLGPARPFRGAELSI
jgi:hypothetical protein